MLSSKNKKNGLCLCEICLDMIFRVCPHKSRHVTNMCTKTNIFFQFWTKLTLYYCINTNKLKYFFPKNTGQMMRNMSIEIVKPNQV